MGGDGHSLALATSGEVFTWGNGENGNLGHGNTERSRRPRIVSSMMSGGIVTDAGGSPPPIAFVAAGNSSFCFTL